MILIAILEMRLNEKDSIIDLSESKNNIVTKIKNLLFNCDGISDQDFSFLPNFINVESVKNISLYIKDTELLKTFLPLFLNLEELNLDIDNNILTKDQINLNKIKCLSVTDSEIENISNDLFINLVNLISLDLSKNKIKTVNAKMFNGLVKLKTLDLSENCIEFIDDDTFHNMIHLTTLNLLDNLIEEFGFLNELKNLEILDLSLIESDNKRKLDLDSTNKCNNLKILKLYDIYYKDLDIKTLTGYNLIYLNIFSFFEWKNINLLNSFDRLEYLCLTLNEKLIETFNKINFENLKYLAIKTSKIPVFGINLINLKAIEVETHSYLEDEVDYFQNLINLKLLKIIAYDDDLLIKIQICPFKKLKLNYFEIQTTNYFEHKTRQVLLSVKDIFMDLFSKTENLKWDQYINKLKVFFIFNILFKAILKLQFFFDY